MANFNDQDMLKKLVDALSGISGNSKYSRPVDDPANSAENALKKYETFLEDEVSIRGKFNKAFAGNWKDVLRTLGGLPKQIDKVYDQIEKDISTNNAAIDKLQKQTIDLVKSQKLNSKEIKKLAEETGKVTSDMSKYSKIHASTSALMEEYKKKEKDVREKYLKDIQDKISKEKELATAKARKDILHEEMLNDHIENLSKSIANADKQLKELAEVNSDIAKQSKESGAKLVETLEKISNSAFFESLDEIDQAHIENLIRNPAEKMSDAVIQAMHEFEQVGDTIQSTLKTLVRASVDHIRNSMSSVTSQIQRMGAMALVSGKSALDTYYAQLGANQLQSTPSSLIPMGMSATEQADVIKQYGREIASITGTQDMSKAYDQFGNSISKLQETALLFGLIGKEAQEFSLKNVRAVNRMGAGGSTAETLSSAQQLMQEVSKTAAFLQMDKMDLSNQISEGIDSGLYDSEIQRLRAQGKSGAELTKALIKNVSAITGNTVQLGYSNTYAKEQLQAGMQEKYKGVIDLLKGKIAGKMEGAMMNSMGFSASDEEKRVLQKKETFGSARLTEDEITTYAKLQKRFSEFTEGKYQTAADTNNMGELMPFATKLEMMRATGGSLADTNSLIQGNRAAIVGRSIDEQTVKDAEGNIISSPVLNFDTQITDAAGNLENFNNALLPFGSAKFASDVQQFLNGVGANPLGNFAGSAISGLGTIAATAIGSGLGAYFAGGAGAAVLTGIGSTLLGVVAPIAIIGVSLHSIFTDLSDLLGMIGDNYKNFKESAKQIDAQTKDVASRLFSDYENRKKSGQTPEISDLYREEYERFTGNKLKETDKFDTVNGIRVNDTGIYAPQQQSIENAVYARQIALTGSKDELSTATPEKRKEILNNQNKLYREKLASMQKTGPNNISSVIQPSNISPNGMVNVSNLTPSPQTNSIIQQPSVTYSDEKLQAIADIKNAAAIGGVSEDTLLRMGYQESKFNPSIKNQTGSSATGLFQFTEGTWKDMMKNYGSKYGVDTANMSDADLLELRKDSKLNALMGMEFTKQNQKIIGSDTLGDTYLAHVFGAGGAKNLIAGKSPIDALGGIQKYNKIIEQNPYLAGLDSEGIRKWANDKMTKSLPTDINSMIGSVPSATANITTTPITTGIQQNVTGNINTNLANPNSNPTSVFTNLLNQFGVNTTVLTEGLSKINDNLHAVKSNTGKTAQNTTPDPAAFRQKLKAQIQGNIASMRSPPAAHSS